ALLGCCRDLLARRPLQVITVVGHDRVIVGDRRIQAARIELDALVEIGGAEPRRNRRYLTAASTWSLGAKDSIALRIADGIPLHRRCTTEPNSRYSGRGLKPRRGNEEDGGVADYCSTSIRYPDTVQPLVNREVCHESVDARPHIHADEVSGALIGFPE